MLEIPTVEKRAGDLLLGDRWFWGAQSVTVESVTDLYEDMIPIGYVRIIGRVAGHLEGWTFGTDDVLTVEEELTWTDEDQQAFDEWYRGHHFPTLVNALDAAKWATERERAHTVPVIKAVVSEMPQRNWYYAGASDAAARIRREIEPVIADLENWGEVLKLGRRHDEAAVVDDWADRLERALVGWVT